MGRERRKNERIDSLVNIAYRSKRGDVKGNSLTGDVSAGGMSLATENGIPNGTELELDIIIDHRGQWIMPAKAKVVWSRRNYEHWRSRYSAGLRFLEIDNENREQLRNFTKRNRWVKSDFETALERNKVPVLGRGGYF